MRRRRGARLAFVVAIGACWSLLTGPIPAPASGRTDASPAAADPYPDGSVTAVVPDKAPPAPNEPAIGPDSTPTPDPTPTTGPSLAVAAPTAARTSPARTTAAPAGPTAPQPVGVGGAWRYLFGDDFSGPVRWGSVWSDTSTAEPDQGHANPDNQQLEWNQAANCSTSDGVLRLTARPDSITSSSGHHYAWSSCLLTSAPSYAFRYGYIELRAQFPAIRGFWPGFWTWQALGNPQWTETDVLEYFSDNPERLYLAQRTGGGGSFIYLLPFNPTTGFHTYGADIRPDGTVFYVDGVAVFRAPGVSSGPTNIVIDNFVYDKIPPAPGSVGVLLVDYVRAWQR